jgi:hypothetical protein
MVINFNLACIDFAGFDLRRQSMILLPVEAEPF